MTVKDTALMQGMRQKLVMLLRSKGINDENVLNSIAKVPRHAFHGFIPGTHSLRRQGN